MVVVFFIISSGGAQNYRDLQDNFFSLGALARHNVKTSLEKTPEGVIITMGSIEKRLQSDP